MSFSVSSSLVLIDPTVDDYQYLVNGVNPTTEVILLDATQDGIEQITAILAQRRTITQLHIVSHGAPGTLHLGNGVLSLETFDHYRQSLTTWFSPAPCSTPAILLYGCNVAAGDAGSEFVEQLHRITGAHIAASPQPVGNAALGGSWDLSVKTGEVGDLAFDVATTRHYGAILPASSFYEDLDSGTEETRAVWQMRNELGTTNDKPSGGTATGNRWSGFGVDYALAKDRGNAYDHGALLYVNDSQYVARGAVAINANRSVDGVPVQMSGLNVQMHYYADPNKPYLRTFSTFENPSDQAITVTVSWVTNLAYDNATVITGSGSGDQTFSTDDGWVIADDDGAGQNGGSAAAFVLYGSGTPSVKTASVSRTVFGDLNDGNTQGILANYTITIPAHSTKAMLWFNGLTGSSGQAQNDMSSLFSSSAALKTSGLLNGLSNDDLGKVLNWQFSGTQTASAGVTINRIDGLTTTEAGGTDTFTVALTSQPSSNVTINLNSSDTTEGTVLPSITFNSSNWNVPQTVTVTGVDDSTVDSNQLYTIQTSISSSDSAYNAINPADISVTNLDNDTTTPGGGTTGGGTTGGGTTGGGTTGGGTTGGGTTGGGTTGGGTTGGTNPDAPLNLVGTSNADFLQGKGGADSLKGLDGDDVLIGLAGDDLLVGGLGKDTSTGGTGADRFVFSGSSRSVALGNSTERSLDYITDFHVSENDKFVIDTDNNLQTQTLPKALYRVGRVKADNLLEAVQSAYSDKNRNLKGDQVLKGGEAVFFTLGSRTYLSVNDGERAFSASSDLVVEVTGIQFQQPGNGPLTVGTYFA